MLTISRKFQTGKKWPWRLNICRDLYCRVEERNMKKIIIPYTAICDEAVTMRTINQSRTGKRSCTSWTLVPDYVLYSRSFLTSDLTFIECFTVNSPAEVSIFGYGKVYNHQKSQSAYSGQLEDLGDVVG